MLLNALERAQINQHIHQRIEVGNARPIPNLGSLDAQFDGLAVDTLGGRALLEDGLVVVTVAVELVANACANARGHGRVAAACVPMWISTRTGLADRLREVERASVAAHFMRDQAGLALKGVLERHGQTGLAQRQARRVKGARGVAAKPPAV